MRIKEDWNKIKCIEKIVKEVRRAKDIDPVQEAYCRQCHGYDTKCKRYKIE